jgi:four helix bundle protein
MKENIVRDKSFAFALRIVKLSRHLVAEQREHVLSRQILRSGTAIGALIREAEQAESKADFVHKMTIALKEANETAYWLELFHQSGYIEKDGFDSIWADNQEWLRLLILIVKTTKANNGKLRMESGQ